MRLCTGCEAVLERGWSCPRCHAVPGIEDGVAVLAPELARCNPGDAQYHHEQLSAAETVHFWFKSRRQLIAWAARRYFRGAARILDVGCGTGGVLSSLGAALPEAEVVGA